METSTKIDFDFLDDVINKVFTSTRQPNFVAGGAVYDLLDGNTPKDVDCFINAFSREEHNMFAERLSKEFTFVKHLGPEEDYRQGNEYIYGVSEYDYKGKPIQLISYTREGSYPFIQSVMSKFDFGICRAAYLGYNRVYESQFRSLDRLNRTLTLRYMQTPHQFMSSHKRLEKLLKKYPGYDFDMNLQDYREPDQA